MKPRPLVWRPIDYVAPRERTWRACTHDGMGVGNVHELPGGRGILATVTAGRLRQCRCGSVLSGKRWVTRQWGAAIGEWLKA